ncbi:hypothetical protein FXN61_09365 [Lentzea sp. PSKA42]|uniref:Uncharacterized protein n=1 Tax=Lentzea indica TaxID=2604800 RepID=A0ABX1FE46_9PSEU|nr:hypothetical protein [Lentzea indica]NKE57034.1 hypothetical protein [Lentzea indica]
MPGTASRAQIDKMFSPENIKANLRKLTETGMQEQGLKYDRRVTDRTGAIGVSFQLSNPKLVSISDNTSTENAYTGGYKAGESSSTSRSVDITAGVNVPIKPNVTAPPSGAGGVAVAGKVTPWSDSKSSSNEIGGSVDRNYVTPAGGRTVLVQLDADVTVVGESRAVNFVHGSTPRAEGATVNLPNSVFVRVSEDVARDMGLLPDVQPNVPKPDFPKMAPPSTIAKDEPGALGLSTVESVPDLSSVVSDLTQKVNDKTAKRFGDSLLPDSVLKDSMSNLQRLVDFSSPASVKAMIDSAMDGGVPLLVHQPGTFGKDSFQVTLRAKAETPQFQEVVNDGVEMESTLSGSQKVSDGQGRGTGWGIGVKAPGLASPGSANPNVSGTAGVIAAANIGQSQSSSVTTSTTDQFSNFRAASGPAARYTVPVEFELVVEKGNKIIASAPSGPQEMTVRLHADNQKVKLDGGLPPLPYSPDAHSRTADQGSPQAASDWQKAGDPATLPPSASVENLRGAKDLREAAVQALKDAGAGKGLTGKGTGSLNSLLSTLSPENLQPHLPGMLSGPLDVPGLHEAALTFGQDADVKVYAKLVDPSLGSLSDGVALENPKSQVTSTSGEAKVTESGDVSVGLATGGAAVKQNTDPKDNVSVGVSGVELRHAGEDSSAVSGGPTDNKTNNLKPKTTTGLVQFGVEYRVVATIGGKTAVVDLSVPNSAAVRMPAADAAKVLRQDFSQDLTDAQTQVKAAADAWRTAEVDVDAKRHDAQQVINEAAAKLAKNDSEFTKVQIDYNSAIEKHLDEQAKVPPLEAQAETARREAARTLDTVAELTPRVSGLSVLAMSAQFEVDDAKADVDAKAQTVLSLENQLAKTPDAEGLRGQIDAARQAHADAQTALRAAETEANAAMTALNQAQQQLDDARGELTVQRDEAAARRADLTAQQQAVAQADAARTAAETRYDQAVAGLTADRAAQEALIKDAETKLDDARREADTKQKEWWDAKAVVDQRIADYNNPPVTTTSSSGTDGGPDLSKALPPTPPADTSKDLPPTPPSSSSHAESSRSAATRPAPPPPASSSTVDASTSADTSVPTEVDNQLSALTADAMSNASPLAQSVETALGSNPGKYVQSEAGLHLLHASVVLDTRTDEIAAMIQAHGVEAVAKSFNKAFDRPIIETAQLQQFADLGNPDNRAKFDEWAHQLWSTVNGSPELSANPDKVAADVFNHDKGYNRGFNFAQEAALAEFMPAPELTEAIATTAVYGSDPNNQALWTQKVLGDAKIIPSAEIVSPEQFTKAVNDNKTVLGNAMGITLDDAKIAELKHELQEEGMVAEDAPDAETRTAPQPPNAPATGNETSGADTDTQAPTSVPSVVVESHLKALTADAMQNASPLARQVETELRSNPGTYLDHQAGLHLLRASVVLDTKADDIATMIQRHGVEAVARAFNKEFGRPIIETAQVQQFGNLSTPDSRSAFQGWAHRMWETVNNTPTYTSDPAKLAADIFNHEKGYNRGTNFAQETAFADVVGAPPLSDVIAGTPVNGNDPYSQAVWVQKVLGDAKVIPSDTLVTAEQFTNAVTGNKTELGEALGVELDDAKIAELKTTLQDYGMVDDDPDPAQPSTWTEPDSPRSHHDPVPPSAPDADTSAPTEVDDQLTALTADAMANASPLAQSVETALRSDSRKYVQSEAGLHLLHASVVLDTRTDQIAAMIQTHGVEAVAKSFNKAFERPIIESAQLEQFADLGNPDNRAKFDDWAHQLWSTVNGAPELSANPDKVAADVFNHDKGYNRGFNFAQEAALAEIMGAPELTESIANTPVYGTDTYSQALWTHKVLSDANIVPSNEIVSPEQFTKAVNDNKTALGNAMGVTLDDAKIAELKTKLQEDGMVDDDPETASEPAPPSAPEPPTEVEQQLSALTDYAMENATPQMKAVEAALKSDPQKYVHHEAGLHLLRASVVLHTRSEDVAGLMFFYGLDEVTKAFNKEFERPIIETEQLEAFVQEGGGEKFDSWAHQLWSTVDNTPSYQANPDKLAMDVFNHDKGYNRAFNLAQQTALTDLVGAPALDDAIATTPVYGTDASSQAFWVQKVLGDAKILPDSSVSAEQFTKAVTDNKTALGDAMGVQLDDQKIAELKTTLQDNGMVDEDLAPSAPPADTHAPGRPPADPSPLHSTATSAPWFDPQSPVSSQAIADARATTPASSWVRGEDGGVLNNTKVGPHGITMQAWRGPIAYDNRVMNVDGVPVRDFTVRLHLNNGNTDVQDRTRAGVEEMFNQGYRLPNGEQFHVTVEFTDNPADAHATVNVTNDPQGRANQLTWPAHTDSRRLAHEVGHFLGLRDEYLETGDVKPVFQDQDGRGRVVNDNSPMTQGIDKQDAQLKPRHLQLIEDRMTALQSHNRPQPNADVDTDVPAPNAPKRDATHIDADPAADATKRARDDDHVFDPGSAPSDVDSDVEMTDPEVQLVNENGVHNAAFANLANGRTLTPITADNYLDRTRQGIENNEPPSFVVSMIVRASELDQLDSVINGVMANTNNMNGRVAFVLGVNASTQADIDTAIAAATPVVNGHAEPIALVSVPHGPKGFKFGETRNSTLNSNAHEFAVTALAANGTHPYVSVMDFDAGDRRTRQGGHVFDHVAQLMDSRVGDDVMEPSRPLMVGGGYRVTTTPQQLHNDVLARINGDTKTTETQRQTFRDKLSEPGFHERFEHVINADMHARRNQQAIHPLLPYTPEPNLFVDGLVPLADPSVRFGEGQAEFGQLGQSLNRFYARELAKLHTPDDPADMDDATERAKVDVQNNRHPVRGQAFATDFVAGDTGTDLSRIAYGLIKDGKLPQSHTALPNVSERFLDGKPAKAGTKFAEERERLASGAHSVVEPLLPPANGQTTNTWNPPRKVETQLGAPQKNRMNPAVSAPMPAPFNQMAAGIQKDQKLVAAHGLVASDHVSNTQRQLRYLNEDVLVRQPAPPTTPNGLYAAIGQARNVDPATLRQQVVSLAATHQAVTRAVADFTVNRPMHQGHLHGALVENVNWHMQSDAGENAGAGNARDLVGHLIATQLNVNVRIHQGGANPVLLRPMGPPFEETVDIEMVMDGRQVTYRPYQAPGGLQHDVQMH